LMYKTIAFLKSQGAEIIEINQISPVSVGGDSFQVLLYEFKDGLNKYFASLGPDAPVKSLEELIEKTFQDSVEMHYQDHDLLVQAQNKGDLNSDEYKKALEKMLVNMRENGIDKVMKENNLDAFVSLTGGPAWKTDLTLGDNFTTSSSSPAAIAGYPNITVPMGYIDGLPVGVNFFGKAWSEPVLLEIAYAYEQASKVRIAPNI
jgi:amidase